MEPLGASTKRYVGGRGEPWCVAAQSWAVIPATFTDMSGRKKIKSVGVLVPYFLFYTAHQFKLCINNDGYVVIQDAGFTTPSQNHLALMLIAGVQVVFTFISCILVDRTGELQTIDVTFWSVLCCHLLINCKVIVETEDTWTIGVFSFHNDFTIGVLDSQVYHSTIKLSHHLGALTCLFLLLLVLVQYMVAGEFMMSMSKDRVPKSEIFLRVIF